MNIIVILVFFSLIESVAHPADSSSQLYVSSCREVALRRRELIDWNAKIAKAGVQVPTQYPDLKKMSGLCKINLTDYLPMQIKNESIPGFNAKSFLNCHGSTKFIAGLNKNLEGDADFEIPANLKDLCAPVNGAQRSGDIGIVFSRDGSALHSFTFIVPGKVLQAREMQFGKYPKLTEISSMESDWFQTQTLKNHCANYNPLPECENHVEYFRCDFSPVNCKSKPPLFESIQLLNRFNKGMECSNKISETICKNEAEQIILDTTKIAELTQRVRSSSLNEAATIAMSYSTELKRLAKKVRVLSKTNDPNERKAISFAIIEMKKLSGVFGQFRMNPEFENLYQNHRDSDIVKTLMRAEYSDPSSPKLTPPRSDNYTIDIVRCVAGRFERSNRDLYVNDCGALFESSIK